MRPRPEANEEPSTLIVRLTTATAGLAAAIAVCGPALAEGGDGAGSAEANVVMIAERQAETETGAVVRAVQAQLSDLAVALQVVWVDELPPAVPDQIAEAEQTAHGQRAIAVFWCDLRLADRIYLYFAAPSGGRMLVRELSGAGQGGLAEALAIIVRSSVEAVLAGGRVGEIVAPVATTEQPAIAERPPEPPPPGPGRVLALTVGYGMDVLCEQRPAVHALVLGLEARLTGPLSVEFGYLLSFPFTERAHGVELTLRRHPAWLGLRAAWLTGDVSLSASLWLQMDVVTEEVRAATAAVAVQGEGTEVLFSLAPLLRAGYLFADRFELFVAAGADLPFRRARYVVGSPSGPLEILDTWPVRPRLLVGLAVGLW